MENCSMNVRILENESGEITVRHLLQKLKIVFRKLGQMLYLSLIIILKTSFGELIQQNIYSILIVKRE